MSETTSLNCSVCGLPKDICACGEQAITQQTNINIRTEKRTYGKLVTIIEGIDASDVDLGALSTELKKKCATGGTLKNGIIELQGNHRNKVTLYLQNKGYPIQG